MNQKTSIWVLSFEDARFKTYGLKEAIATHISVPETPVPPVYYGMTIPYKFDANAFIWVWKYINGSDNSKVPIPDESYSTIVKYLEALALGGTSYPILLLMQRFLSSHLSPRNEAELRSIFERYMMLFPPRHPSFPEVVVPIKTKLYHRTKVDRAEFYPDRGLNWFGLARVNDPGFGAHMYVYETTRPIRLIDFDFGTDNPNATAFSKYVRAHGHPEFVGKSDSDFKIVCEYGYDGFADRSAVTGAQYDVILCNDTSRYLRQTGKETPGDE